MKPPAFGRGAAAALALALAGCAAHTEGTGTGPPSASAAPATPAPSPRSDVTSPPPPASTAAAHVGLVTAHARAAATPAADPLPYILHISLSPTVVSSGSTISASVRTTPSVVSVVAYAAGGSMPIPRAGVGLFNASTSLPPLPSFVHGVYPVTFVARDRRGRTTQAAVNVTVP